MEFKVKKTAFTWYMRSGINRNIMEFKDGFDAMAKSINWELIET